MLRRPIVEPKEKKKKRARPSRPPHPHPTPHTLPQISDVKALIAAANTALAGQTLVLIYQGKVREGKERREGGRCTSARARAPLSPPLDLDASFPHPPP